MCKAEFAGDDVTRAANISLDSWEHAGVLVGMGLKKHM
jgi:hypothetical protein